MSINSLFKYDFGLKVVAVQTFPNGKITQEGVITARKLYQPSSFKEDAYMAYYLLDPTPEFEHDDQVWVLESEIK